MAIVIFKGAFNSRYVHTAICIYFIIQDTGINAFIEVSYLSILATCFLRG